MNSQPARAGELFTGAWEGVGEVSTFWGHLLRRLDVRFRAQPPAADGSILFDEMTRQQNGPVVLARSWHIRTDGEGAFVGVEASQGGRLVAEDRPWGCRLTFDRPRVVRGPNVANLTLRVRRTKTGLEAVGWSRVVGVPAIRTHIRISPTTEAGVNGTDA